ncbi:MAG: response regulator, partial [Bacteroidales bacterium]|nr:response regulator [Bacteroidales bacterium]
DKLGNWRWVESRGQFIKSNEQGVPVILIGISKDITDRKLAEESLVENEQKYRLIFNYAPVGIFQLDEKGIIKAFNNLFLEITGLNKNQISGIDFLKLTNPGIALKTLEALRGSNTSYEGPLDMASNNLTIPVRLLMSPIIGRKSRVEGVIGLIEDRSHQKEKEELKTKVAIAEESVKFKQNFLANMSHEIRTPLTGIMGMAEILSKTPLLPQQKEYLGILKNTSENLMEIINQVLDFSKIEAGKLSLKLESFKFSTIIQLSEKYFNSICTKSISFHSYIDDHIPDFVIADKNRIIQVINNMLGNSVKFTEKGSITIEAWPGSENEIQTENQLFGDSSNLFAIKILVSDTGMGISKEKQKELFLPFSQIEQNDARRFEGTGLGLSICKQLVEMHGGKIGVISQPGKGSTFWFTFVCKKAYEEKQNLSNTGAIEAKEIHPLRILLAEDKKVNQQVIKLMLTNMGHEVEIAENGLKVFEMFKPGCFDLILMDIQMPLMDGIAATQELRTRYSELPPIIGLSANAFEGDREKYIARGMDDYLTKPVKTEDFATLINRLFAQKT